MPVKVTPNRHATFTPDPNERPISNTNLPWQWVSFADSSLPEGLQFLGVAIIRARDVADAAAMAHALGINPGGEVLAMPVPADFGDPPIELDHKLVTDKIRIAELTEKWIGGECVNASADDVT
jgi:hypothetical protein